MRTPSFSAVFNDFLTPGPPLKAFNNAGGARRIPITVLPSQNPNTLRAIRHSGKRSPIRRLNQRENRCRQILGKLTDRFPARKEKAEQSMGWSPGSRVRVLPAMSSHRTEGCFRYLVMTNPNALATMVMRDSYRTSTVIKGASETPSCISHRLPERYSATLAGFSPPGFSSEHRPW